MIIETALVTYLLAQSTVTALVGDRIDLGIAKQTTIKPYVVISKISGVREHSHDGESGLAHPRLQISVFANSYGSAKQVTEAIRGVLDCYTGTMGGEGGVVVQAVFLEDETDFYEGEATNIYQVATDYIIWHEES